MIHSEETIGWIFLFSIRFLLLFFPGWNGWSLTNDIASTEAVLFSLSKQKFNAKWSEHWNKRNERKTVGDRVEQQQKETTVGYTRCIKIQKDDDEGETIGLKGFLQPADQHLTEQPTEKEEKILKRKQHRESNKHNKGTTLDSNIDNHVSRRFFSFLFLHWEKWEDGGWWCTTDADTYADDRSLSPVLPQQPKKKFVLAIPYDLPVKKMGKRKTQGRVISSYYCYYLFTILSILFFICWSRSFQTSSASVSWRACVYECVVCFCCACVYRFASRNEVHLVEGKGVGNRINIHRWRPIG